MSDAAPAYAPAGPRASAAIVALYVKVGACLLVVGADVRRIVVAGDLRDGRAQVDALLAADQLVDVATVLEVVTLLVAVVLVLRWAVVARRNLPALGDASLDGGDPRIRRLLRGWALALAVAVAAVVVSRVAFADAEDVADRQRIDTARAIATVLFALATGATIAALSAVTARQAARARDAGVDRPGPVDDEASRVSEGGLQVVSEEQARRDSPAL